MARRRFAGRRFPASVGRQTAWAVGPNGELAHTSSVAQAFGVTSVPLVDGLTLIRIRGEFLFFVTSGDANGAGFTGAVGIAVVENNAVAAGIGSLPTPLTDAGDEMWVWHSFFHAIVASTASPSQQPAATLRLVIDSKAMRKNPVGTTLFAAVEVAESGVAVAESHLQTRVLDKLP